jgi:hypothetical protein
MGRAEARLKSLFARAWTSATTSIEAGGNEVDHALLIQRITKADQRSRADPERYSAPSRRFA